MRARPVRPNIYLPVVRFGVADSDWFSVLSATTAPVITEPQPSAVAVAKQIEEAEATLTLPAFYFARRPDVPREIEEVQLALNFG